MVDYQTESNQIPECRYLFLCDDPENDKTNMKRGVRVAGDELNDLTDFLGNHKVLIVVTMYNEDRKLFHKTMRAINHNLEELVKLTVGSNSLTLDNIAVVVVADGIDKFTQNLEDEDFEYYKNIFDPEKIISDHDLREIDPERGEVRCNVKKISEKLKKKLEENKKVNDQSLSIRSSRINKSLAKKESEYAVCFKNKLMYESFYPELTVYFCAKLENKRKLNSHLWFFGGFCRVINPEFCILIDVGTITCEKSLYYLCEAMSENKNVAGVCGEILPEYKDESLFTFLVKAQKVEYKFSHILDKSLETLFGYISVLPGAFSAYRWSCLKPDDIKGPLWGSYFKSLMEPEKMTCYYSNIYLAEDRVLCLALVSCKNESYILKYVEKAKAFTDPPLDYSTLLSQRRRWINGSWFAMIDSLWNWQLVWGSNHSCCRKTIFTIQMIYYAVNVIYSFFLVGCFYLSLSICLRKQFGYTAADPNAYIATMLQAWYIMMLVVTLVLSLGSRIQELNSTFQFISAVFSFYMVLTIILIVKIFFLNVQVYIVWIPVGIIVVCFTFILSLNKSLIKVGIGCIHYLILTPTYVNVFNIYAICNIHDCTWGNRPDNPTKEEVEKKEDFEKFRTGWVLLWSFFNSYFGYVLDAENASSSSYNIYIYSIGMAGMAILAIRFIGGILFFFNEHYFKLKCFPNGNDKKPKESQAINSPNNNI